MVRVPALFRQQYGSCSSSRQGSTRHSELSLMARRRTMTVIAEGEAIAWHLASAQRGNS